GSCGLLCAGRAAEGQILRRRPLAGGSRRRPTGRDYADVGQRGAVPCGLAAARRGEIRGQARHRPAPADLLAAAAPLPRRQVLCATTPFPSPWKSYTVLAFQVSILTCYGGKG